jgi:hypothetical protein
LINEIEKLDSYVKTRQAESTGIEGSFEYEVNREVQEELLEYTEVLKICLARINHMLGYMENLLQPLIELPANWNSEMVVKAGFKPKFQNWDIAALLYYLSSQKYIFSESNTALGTIAQFFGCSKHEVSKKMLEEIKKESSPLYNVSRENVIEKLQALVKSIQLDLDNHLSGKKSLPKQ